ncbi:MAG: hypothetical protein PHY09_11460 [Desulfuromonadaceae bacterium]|nr:hypothetical protein [Desulfuromonadaceae bacterium]MDD5106742.1 hypothetical protein [Desulfuromonadaceae bacterium]
MMIILIVMSTMVTVAVIVFATQYQSMKKEMAKREKIHIRKGSVRGAQEAPLAS